VEELEEEEEEGRMGSIMAMEIDWLVEDWGEVEEFPGPTSTSMWTNSTNACPATFPYRNGRYGWSRKLNGKNCDLCRIRNNNSSNSSNSFLLLPIALAGEVEEEEEAEEEEGQLLVMHRLEEEMEEEEVERVGCTTPILHTTALPVCRQD
jgi:hypothetical protein